MKAINEIINNRNVILYGIGTETERVLNEWNGKYKVLGLLDGFRNSGEIYGYPILDIDNVVELENIVIIVVARPGSCKAIAKRIGDICRENHLELFDFRGNDLLEGTKVVYDFTAVNGYTKTQLLDKASEADVVSFDLFDTLIVRNIISFEDMIELVLARIQEKNICTPDFKSIRLAVEKELSRNAAPKLEKIYESVLEKVNCRTIHAKELAELEYETDRALLSARMDMLNIISEIKSMGKEVYITSESYYGLAQIQQIINDNNIKGIDKIFVSCEYNKGKLSGLFDEVKKSVGDKKILHIGDDLTADFESAKRSGIDTFHIYSSSELFDLLGGLNLEDKVVTLSDKIKLGIFKAKLFNSPFQFEDEKKRIHVDDSADLGYLFCAPLIFDFAYWFGEQVKNKGIQNILFSARDGYLLNRFYSNLYPEIKSHYFLTSRISAIRAGVRDGEDITYVDSMRFGGSIEDNLKVRFGIDTNDISPTEIVEEEGLKKFSKAILRVAEIKRVNNLKYIKNLNLNAGRIAMFDFVAKGTSQMFVQKLFKEPILGLYFLQLEPEFMKDKGLNIIPFYTSEEREHSAIFDNYYILETVLTSPEPSVDEFDEEGNAVFAEETRSYKDIDCIMRAQNGIINFIDTFLKICPRESVAVNKSLDEAMLMLIHNVQIRDNDFLKLKVEDPFFNRMTDIIDVL